MMDAELDVEEKVVIASWWWDCFDKQKAPDTTKSNVLLTPSFFFLEERVVEFLSFRWLLRVIFFGSASR
jgi:hypothetical protein